MTDQIMTAPRSRNYGALLRSPIAWLAGAVAFCIVLLLLPLTLPIGPMNWDVYIYYDAANRIADGQIPIVDFFTPVGPLGYYLFALVNHLFPNGQPTLVAHWALLVVSAPLFALVLLDVGRQSRTTAFALLVPFLIFALLPFNTREFYPFPGSDGFGIYNRQVCHILYILVAAIMFVKDRRLLVALACLSMTALFFLKITGFVAGGIICLYAFLAGRIVFRPAVAIFGIFLAILAIVEVLTGLVSKYAIDILALLQMNSGTLAPRFLQAASLTFSIVVAVTALIGLLAWTTWKNGLRTKRTGVQYAQAFLDQDWMWLGVVLFAGIFFETQNTGSQALIFLWPVLLRTLQGRLNLLAKPALYGAIAALTAAAILPPMATTIEKAGRAYVGALKNIPLAHRNLKTLGAVSMRDDVVRRADHMRQIYAQHPNFIADVSAAGELPTPLLYSDFDFQALYLSSIDDAIEAIRGWERDRGVHFETLMSLNFVNPFPWLMDRQAPFYIAIGADPTRAVPNPGPQEVEAVRQTDLALIPTCPATSANAMLYDIYKPGLADHKRIKLTDCYDALVNPKFASAFPDAP